MSSERFQNDSLLHVDLSDEFLTGVFLVKEYLLNCFLRIMNSLQERLKSDEILLYIR